MEKRQYKIYVVGQGFLEAHNTHTDKPDLRLGVSMLEATCMTLERATKVLDIITRTADAFLVPEDWNGVLARDVKALTARMLEAT